jgi:hypothetical protein
MGNIMYLDKVQQIYRELELSQGIPVPPEKVDELEQELGLIFPAAYREFLLWVGEDSGDIFQFARPYQMYGPPNDNHESMVYSQLALFNAKYTDAMIVEKAHKTASLFHNPEISPLLERAMREIADTGKGLPEDYFIFLEQQDFSQIWLKKVFFVRLSEGDNPPVYERIINDTAYKLVATSFSDFIADGIHKRENQLGELNRKYGIAKPFVQTHFLDAVKTEYAELGLPPVKACTVQEVKNLERRHGFAFPSVFREFLLWGVHWAQNGLDDAIYCYKIYELKEIAIGILAENKCTQKLPEDAVVFWMEQASKFSFICASESEDAPVFDYDENKNIIKLNGNIEGYLIRKLILLKEYKIRYGRV